MLEKILHLKMKKKQKNKKTKNKTVLIGIVKVFSVDYDPIYTSNILHNHRFLNVRNTI